MRDIRKVATAEVGERRNGGIEIVLRRLQLATARSLEHEDGFRITLRESDWVIHIQLGTDLRGQLLELLAALAHHLLRALLIPENQSAERIVVIELIGHLLCLYNTKTTLKLRFFYIIT